MPRAEIVFGSVADVCCPFRLLPSLPQLRDHQSCYKHQNGSDKLGARQGQAQSLQRRLGPLLNLLSVECSPSHLAPVGHFESCLWRGLDSDHRLLLKVANSTDVLVSHVGQCRGMRVKRGNWSKSKPLACQAKPLNMSFSLLPQLTNNQK